MQDTSTPDSGALEKPDDAGKGEAGEIARWLMELDLADKQEKKWRENSNRAIERYRDEKDRTDWKFNILWSNVEVLRPHLYSATPKADVRQRFRDKDPVGNACAEVMERALDYCNETYDFDGVMNNVILDYVLPGRAVARVRFEPVIDQRPVNPQMQESPQQEAMEAPAQEAAEPPAQEQQEHATYPVLSYARTYIERVQWDKFRRGPGAVWDEVPWIAYEHHLTRAEIGRQFPGMGETVTYDIVMSGVDEKKTELEPSVFKRVRVWEIWDKEKKEILYLAPSVKERFLKREPDKYNLEGFFDCPRPLYAIESGTTLVPQVEFEMYRDQAKELDRITMRISKLVNSLKQRGIYDSTIAEFKELFKAADNEMVPTSSSQMAMAAGGMEKAIWMMPIAEAAQVLNQLVLQREQVKQTIYEIMGIGDILRGTSDPNETLGAQQLKAQTGSLRMQRRQRDVQRFVRDLLRKKAELIAENYTPELLSLMTGIKLPGAEAKQQAQAMLQQAQMSQQPAPPEAQKIASSPSWDEVMQVLKSDLLRSFRIDIETDSTIAADQAAERQQVTELVTGIGGFVQAITPAVQGGVMSMEAAKAIMLAAMRRFKLGRQVEAVLDEDAEKPQPPKAPDPAAMKAEADIKAAQADTQLKQQESQARLQLEEQKAQADVGIAQSKAQADAQAMMAKHANDRAVLEQDAALARERMAGELAIKREEMLLSVQLKREEMQARLALEQAKASHQAQLNEAAMEKEDDGDL